MLLCFVIHFQDGETALHYVSMLQPVGSEKGHELDIAKLLVDNSADTTILNTMV